MRLRADLAAAGLLVASCAAPPPPAPRLALKAPDTQRIAVADGPARIGAAYRINGVRYVPADVSGLSEIGPASWYGDEARGQTTASGERFDPDGMSAAHPTLPLPSYVDVTSLDTGRTILVRINDRGPFHGGRILDMSLGAARALGMMGHGARPIHIMRVLPSPDDAMALRQGKMAAARPLVSGARLAAWRTQSGWSPPVDVAQSLPGGTGPLWLQVASFSSPSRAAALAKRLGAQISPIGAIYRVRLGPFSSPAEAKAALAPLAATGYPDVRIVR